jgi:hypothetical protein
VFQAAAEATAQAQAIPTATGVPGSGVGFDTIDELVDAQEEQCVNIRTRQEDMRSRTLYHWWPLLA